jgi:hypothetical protein
MALRALEANDTLKVLLADTGNVTVVVDTADYNWKITALLDDHANRKLKKNPIESVECKTGLLLKKSLSSEEVCQQLRAQGSRLPRLYGLPKIHNQGDPLRPTLSTTGAPTYPLAKHLAGLLRPHTGFSPCQTTGYYGQL